MPFVTLLLPFMLTTAHAETDARSAEVAEIVTNLLETHPEGLRLRQDPVFTAAADSLQGSAETLDLAEYVMGLHRLFTLVGDGHTAVLSIYMSAEPFELRTPILVQPFADGMYVVEARSEALPLLGHRITKVNGFDVDEVLTSYVESAPSDNPAFAMRWSPFLFASPGWLLGLGFASPPYDAPIDIEAQSGSGETVRAELLPRVGANVGREALTRSKSRVEKMLQEENTPNFARLLRDEGALFIAIDAMEDAEDKSFSDFTMEVRESLSASEIERVIIDLRRNGGGNNMLCEPLRRILVKSRFNRPGGIYILAGGRTFSAAMNFATRLERESDALFVGEPTGGRPNHYGDAKMFRGSVTGIPYLVSTLRWSDSTPFDKRRWVLPDIPVVATFDDYVAGRDAALHAALSHVPEETSMGYRRAASPWSRSSQQAGWRFFFQPDSEGVSGPRK